MSLQEEITNAWKDAMKARDPKKSTLALIRTEMKNAAIKGRAAGSDSTEIDDDAAKVVLQRMAKQRRESIVEYKKGERADLVEKEEAELKCIASFLPAALSDDELGALIQGVIDEVGATSMKDMGKLMKPILAKAAGRADGKRVQAMLREKLG